MSSPESQEPNDFFLVDPDIRLMLAFKDGDKAAFEELMRKYFPRVLNFIYRFVGSREIAEDLTQEVFIRVYQNARQYDPKAKLQTWLFTIAKNLSLNELRRHRNKMVSLDSHLQTPESSMPRQVEDARSVGADQAVIQEEKSAAVRQAIQTLPENQRMAVILRRYEQLSYEEIAQAMRLSEKAVKSLLNRAKENLKNALTEVLKDH